MRQRLASRPGVNVWLDMEGVASATTASDAAAYCNAWYDVVDGAGFVPAIYCGYGTGMTASQLYHDLKFAHYWSSPRFNGGSFDIRGWQLRQQRQQTPHGVTFDPDTAQSDLKGDSAFWLARPDWPRRP